MGSIIGVSCLSHDAAIAVIKDNQILFASQSERYSRKKNDKFLNVALIDEAVKYSNGVDKIIFYERPFLKRTRHLFAGQFKKALFSETPYHYLNRFSQFHRRPFQCVDHHLSHACSGYFTSTFHDAAIVVADGIGEWETLTIWRAQGRILEKIASVKYPNSLGLLYSAFTQRIGFKPNEEEYIMMGLASLGKPIYADLIRQEFMEKVEFPHFKLKVNMHRGIRNWRLDLKDIENIAASCQKVIEDLLLELFEWVRKNIPSKNLVFSGGVALNCVFNQKLANSAFFDNIWILPEPGDAGNSIGAALAVTRDWVEWKGPYLGHDMGRNLDVDGALAALLAGKIIGVAHGRAEFGPRALGNRSLIADPRNIATKDRVNKIKKRELFRPFAPVVLEEQASSYFDLHQSSSPYMQFVATCKQPSKIPAVCHVDGSSRIQTLRHDQNPAFHLLLKRFYEATQCPVLLNTSLNIKGEPLVNNWEDAQRFSALHKVEIF